MILTLRTDKPDAEIGLYDSDGKQIDYVVWQAHRHLSETLLTRVETLLQANDMNFDTVKVIIFYEGPGSFTGLRIGAAFANAMEVPVVNSSGENWIASGIKRLAAAKAGAALPLYGREAHITSQKK